MDGIICPNLSLSWTSDHVVHMVSLTLDDLVDPRFSRPFQPRAILQREVRRVLVWRAVLSYVPL